MFNNKREQTEFLMRLSKNLASQAMDLARDCEAKEKAGQIVPQSWLTTSLLMSKISVCIVMSIEV